MLREYLLIHAKGDEEEDEEEGESGSSLGHSISKRNIDELEKLAGQLTISDTPEKVFEIKLYHFNIIS